jgi:hypothetical protein
VLVQQREQGPALHAQAVQARIQAVIAHVHHRTFARRVAIQAVHRRGMRAHCVEQAHLPQHLQAAGLQQEAGTDRPRRGHRSKISTSWPSRVSRMANAWPAVP